LAACWLVAIAVNLVAMEKFYDIAVRDVLLAVAAFALARLSAVRQSELAVSDAIPRETAPTTSGILSLNI